MRLTIAAVGRLRAGPEKSLAEDYLKRLKWPVLLREVADERARSTAERRHREGQRLLEAVPPGARIIALDPRGEALSSEAFASRLAAWQEGGIADLVFLIGGAEGLAPELRERAELVLSFGPMTWPHQLARAMLAEQLYRAQSILSGHPYHRRGPRN